MGRFRNDHVEARRQGPTVAREGASTQPASKAREGAEVEPEADPFRDSARMKAQRRLHAVVFGAAAANTGVIQCARLWQLLRRRKLRELLVNVPGDDPVEEEEFELALDDALEHWRHFEGEEVPDDVAEQRSRLVERLHAAGAPDGLIRRWSYYLGLGRRPRPQRPGAGTVALVRGVHGGIVALTGRPGLFAVETGAASQARRHVVAWHTLRALMNRVIAMFGPHDLAWLSARLVEVTDEVLTRQAAVIADRECEGDPLAFRIIWLAVVLNNLPHNLWLGPAGENIAINTLCLHLSRWNSELLERRDVPTFRAHLAAYGSSSRRARRVVEALIHHLDEQTVEFPMGDAALVIYDHVLREVLPGLEIDPGRGEQVTRLQRFLYEFAVGDVTAELGLIENALMGFIESGVELQAEREAQGDSSGNESASEGDDGDAQDGFDDADNGMDDRMGDRMDMSD